MLGLVGDAKIGEMPDMIWKTREQIFLVSSEITTSSDGFSDMIDVGVIALEDHEHVQRDVRAKTKNMLT